MASKLMDKHIPTETSNMEIIENTAQAQWLSMCRFSNILDRCCEAASTNHQETISKDDMKIALCDDALRLSIKDELE